jgi:hypothetical protein
MYYVLRSILSLGQVYCKKGVWDLHSGIASSVLDESGIACNTHKLHLKRKGANRDLKLTGQPDRPSRSLPEPCWLPWVYTHLNMVHSLQFYVSNIISAVSNIFNCLYIISSL